MRYLLQYILAFERTSRASISLSCLKTPEISTNEEITSDIGMEPVLEFCDF